MADKIGVFVSHHHSQEEDVSTARLVADLEAAGADVWVDYQGVESGSFVQKINEGLSGRQWLVLVMTNAALGSRWVQDEVNAALHQVNLGRMRGVIPFVISRCDEARIPPLWAQLHRYDATKDYRGALIGLALALGLKDVGGNTLGESQQVVQKLAKDISGGLSTSTGLLDRTSTIAKEAAKATFAIQREAVDISALRLELHRMLADMEERFHDLEA
jgi:hypothetical protein